MNKVIEVIKFIIIGIVQGISEILPISSSAHLAITYKFLSIDNLQQFNLTIFLHFASCIALCIYFKDLLFKMFIGTFKYIFKKDVNSKKDFMLLIYIIIASIPSVLVGVFLKPLVEESFNNIIFICINLIITSFLLLLFPLFKKKTNNEYTFKNTFITGLFQCFALFPGISRSGITLFGSKVARLENEKGKTFSFLLLLPISFGSFILSILDFSDSTFNINQLYLYVISMIITFIFSILSLNFFVKKTRNIPYYYYTIYLIIVSIITLICSQIYF